MLQSIALMSALSFGWLLLRARFGQRISARTRHAVGLILIAGLLVPIRPVLPILPAEMAGAGQTEQAQTGGAPAAPVHAAMRPETLPGIFPFEQDAMLAEQLAAPSATHMPNFARIAAIIWAIGALLMAGIQAARHLCFCRRAHRFPITLLPYEARLLTEECARLEIRRAPRLRRCDLIPSPMLSGLMRSVITLPRQPLPETETRFILRHELVHLRRRDLWGKALVLLTAIIHWYNPAVYCLAKAIDADCEMACDQAALEGADCVQRARYGRLLLAAASGQAVRCPPLSTGLTQGGVHMKKRIVSLLNPHPGRFGGALVALALALTLCSGVALAQEAGLLSPTTGLAYSGEYRPIVAVIENDPAARPHPNMSEADVVYETVYWGPHYTRYTVVYNDNHPDYVGSLRGSRVFNFAIRQEWDAPIVCWGGQMVDGPSDIVTYCIEQGVTGDFIFSGVKFFTDKQAINVTHNSSIMFRVEDRQQTGPDGKLIERMHPHNAIADLAAIEKLYWPKNADGTPYEPRQRPFKFSQKPTRGEDTAVAIDIRYDDLGRYTPSYTFNAEKRVYERWYAGEEQYDGVTGKRIEASNVIVQYAKMSYVGNNASRPLVELIGTGPIDAFIDGTHIRGTWTREDDNSPTVFADMDGVELTLLPGKTFIQQLPWDIGFSYTDAEGNQHVTHVGTQGE